jgi:anti-sigma regulatory factor (Ser/Thr protein kinase)
VQMDLQLSGGPMAPRLAREAVSSLRDQVPPGLLDDVRLVITELVTNSVLHGSVGPTDQVHVRIRVEGSTVTLEVDDPGRGAPAKASPREDQTGGWGLFLVDRLADRWGVKQGPPASVWAELSVAS